jgi:hypothetical protein
VVARKSPDSPANRPVEEKAAMVAAAAGTGSLTERREPAGRFSVATRGVGVPLSGTGATPVRKRPTSSAGRSFHAASNPAATSIVATPASIAPRRPMRAAIKCSPSSVMIVPAAKIAKRW